MDRERQRKALEAHLSGQPDWRIAQVLGYVTSEEAHADIAELLTIPPPAVAESIARIDGMIAALYVRARQGDVAAARVIMDLETRRDRLIGGQAGERTGSIISEFERRLAERRARAAGE